MAKESFTLTTLGAQVKKWADTDPDTPAFIFVDPTWQRRVLSKGAVFRLAARFAAILKRLGVRRGDVVSNTLANSPERVLTHVGVILAGAVSMNGQVFLKDGDDFVGSLRDAGCVAVILDPRQPKGAADLLRVRERVVAADGKVVYPELPAFRHVLEVCLTPEHGDKSLMETLEEEEEMYFSECRPDDIVVVRTTSGSTGFSKLVPLSHRNVLLFGEAFTSSLGLAPGDLFYSNGPLGWACSSLTTYLTCGMTSVLPDFSRHEVEDQFAFIWELICREKCTGAFLVPFYIEKLVKNFARKRKAVDGDQSADSDVQPGTSPTEDWKLRVMASGGQPLKRPHLAALGTITRSIHVAYGSTETGLMTWGPVDDAASYESCNNGRPYEGVELKVVNESGDEVGVGQMGEIMCRSQQAFLGYLNNDASTQKTRSPDGWINTGDIGSLNEKGEVFVYCRKAFSIIRGAYVLYPGWLETRLLKHPGIVNVMIVPVPDPLLHQELCACVVTQPGAKVTAEGVKVFCEDLFLRDQSDHMTAVPRYVLFFDTLPTTPTGKTCRRTTAALAAQRLGLEPTD